MTKKRKVLVTGANGLIGGRIAELASSYDIIATSRTKSNWVDFVVDFNDQKDILNLLNHVKPDVVINAGGITAVELAEAKTQEASRVNVEAVKTIADWCDDYRTRLIQFSTDFVFDGQLKSYCETDKTNPLSHYGQTKLESEIVALRLNSSAVIRTSLVYGATNRMSRSNFPIWIYNELSKGKKLTITADQYRSPTYIDDLAMAVIDLIDHDFCGVMHIAGPERLSVYDFALKVLDHVQLSSNQLIPITTEMANQIVKRPLSTGLDIRIAAESIRYNPLTPQQGLKRLFDNL